MTALAFGIPLAALLAVAGYGVNRLYPRRFSSTGIGNALLELHVVLEPQRDRIEMRLPIEDEDIGDGRPEIAGNVIRIDFVRKRRLSSTDA